MLKNTLIPTRSCLELITYVFCDEINVVSTLLIKSIAQKVSKHKQKNLALRNFTGLDNQNLDIISNKASQNN